MPAQHESDMHKTMVRRGTRTGLVQGAAAGGAVGALSRRTGAGALIGAALGASAGRAAGRERVLRDVVREERGQLKAEAKKSEKVANGDMIAGGLADNKSPGSFSSRSVNKGQKVEMEHTNNKSMAKEIARDHLTEDPAYYDKLRKMEKKSSGFADGLGKVSFVPAVAGLAARAVPALTNLGTKVVGGVGRGVKAVAGPQASQGFGKLVGRGVQASGGQQQFMRNVGIGTAALGTAGAVNAMRQ